MYNANNNVQKKIEKSARFLMVFGLMGLTSLLLTGCFSSWALSPRDKSIKEWEAQHQSKNEKSSDSVQENAKKPKRPNDLNFKG